MCLGIDGLELFVYKRERKTPQVAHGKSSFTDKSTYGEKCSGGGPPLIRPLLNSPIALDSSRTRREKVRLALRVRACRSPQVLRRFSICGLVHARYLCSRSPGLQARLGESRIATFVAFSRGILCTKAEDCSRDLAVGAT
jgi:hypothetical protein